MNGAIIQVHTIELVKKLDETRKNYLSIAITDIRQRFESQASEIILPFAIDYGFPGITFTIPKIGDKKKTA